MADYLLAGTPIPTFVSESGQESYLYGGGPFLTESVNPTLSAATATSITTTTADIQVTVTFI